MSSPVSSLYHIFKRGDASAAKMRPIIVAMVAIAIVITFAAVVRVTRQHEVLRLGAELSRASEKMRALREQNRELSLARATLTAPDRIRRLGTQLGMTTVAPDRIRVVVPGPTPTPNPKVTAL
ncbi:MAG: cell division protein FtsL, partial [Proteobacteria bacterium]|nr:cell division protein FtsL [Pseudomonadota bacterium]